jgi:hypothetical protein
MNTGRIFVFYYFLEQIMNKIEYFTISLKL